MSVLKSIAAGIGEALVVTVETQRGRSFVKQCVDYRPERARVLIQQEVALAVSQNNRPFVMAMFEEFGAQILQAESLQLQQELGQLLWHFKERLTIDSAAGELE